MIEVGIGKPHREGFCASKIPGAETTAGGIASQPWPHAQLAQSPALWRPMRVVACKYSNELIQETLRPLGAAPDLFILNVYQVAAEVYQLLAEYRKDQQNTKQKEEQS